VFDYNGERTVEALVEFVNSPDAYKSAASDIFPKPGEMIESAGSFHRLLTSHPYLSAGCIALVVVLLLFFCYVMFDSVRDEEQEYLAAKKMKAEKAKADKAKRDALYSTVRAVGDGTAPAPAPAPASGGSGTATATVAGDSTELSSQATASRDSGKATPATSSDTAAPASSAIGGGTASAFKRPGKSLKDS